MIVAHRSRAVAGDSTSWFAVSAEALLILTLAWGAFAFGAVYPWAYWPLAVTIAVIGAVGLAFRSRQWMPPAGYRALGGAFVAFLVAGLVQIVPLPLGVVSMVSPEASRVLRQLDLAMASGILTRHPFSIDPMRTATALGLFAANALLLLGCVRLFSMRGARRVAGAIAFMGVALALVGMVQNRLSVGEIYGFWVPLEPDGSAFGPFVNRNHFAGWMLMALPVTLGLVCGGFARAMRGVKPTWHARLLWLSSAGASQLVLLGAGAFVMALSLAMTMSRSGMTALVLAVILTGSVAARRQTSIRRKVAVAYLVVLVVSVIWWAGADAIASRFAQGNWSEMNDRRGAWADALGVASKFPVAGTGLNTYGVATLFYQQHDRSQHYDQAHNDYLQLAAEGGLLLTIPAGAALAIFAYAVRRRFLEETGTASYWLRVGAVTGLVAVALQETVDFSLQMPGNAALCVVLCAMALHRPPRVDKTVRPSPAPGPSRRNAAPLFRVVSENRSQRSLGGEA